MIRLLCFPPAGGYAVSYRGWQATLTADARVHPVQPPDGCAGIDEVLDAVERTALAVADAPLALFGHSFGALVAYEIAHRLGAHGCRTGLLAVSACPAPPLVGPAHRLAPPAGADRRLVAWYALADRYRPRPHPPLACPVTAFGGMSDPVVDRAELAAWGGLTTGEFRLRMLPGSHDLIRDSGGHLVRALALDLRRWLPPQRDTVLSG